MNWIMAAARLLSQFGLWFGGCLILLAALLIGIDVVMRVGFNRSIGGADELAGYALAIGAVWGLGATLLDRAHIRIDSLYILFPAKLRVILDFVGLTMLLAFFALITWHGFGVVEQSIQSGSRSQSALETPLVIPQSLWIAGLCTFLLIGLVLFIHALGLALRGDAAGVARTIGTRSAEEEVEEEMIAMRERARSQDTR